MNIIVDYGLGNIKSAQMALNKAGIETIVSDNPALIEKAKFILLPGVGAFRDAISALSEKKLDQSIKKFADNGGLLVGICLGMQLLYDRSFEHGEYEGLGLVKGDIVKLKKEKKVPHMGWNNLKIYRKDPLFKYISEGEYVYFVHSYYAHSQNDEMIAYADYGERIPAIIRKGNIIGFQFHPEKSGETGVKLLKALGEILNDNFSGN
ncbi:MAG: imidazole glycerol phosphate synthase subunit HisH [Clostridiales bacterium]|nr:imidazole glycerol phosphate synthase subunit HisH [Clostridiales bacterium]